MAAYVEMNIEMKRFWLPKRLRFAFWIHSRQYHVIWWKTRAFLCWVLAREFSIERAWDSAQAAFWEEDARSDRRSETSSHEPLEQRLQPLLRHLWFWLRWGEMERTGTPRPMEEALLHRNHQPQDKLSWGSQFFHHLCLCFLVCLAR